MGRRRGRSSLTGFLTVLLLGAAAGAAVLFWTRKDRDHAPPVLHPHTEVAVEVLNGCGIDGAARRVATLLRRAGYQVERVADADHFHYRNDVVILRTGPRGEGETLAALLDDAPLVEQRVEGHPYQFSVVVGRPHPLVPPP